VASKVASYVGERDEHSASLTVAETLEFARRVQGKVKDCCTMMRVMGIDHVRDTVIGDERSRGVSGGQRKRVTIAEMLLGNARVICGDEITTGLDSQTALEIVRALKNAATVYHLTVVCALLQPPPEVYAAFDRLVLLDAGRVVYDGDDALAYFRDFLGYVVPERKDEADFLVEVTAAVGRSYHPSPSLYSADDFARAFDDHQQRSVKEEEDEQDDDEQDDDEEDDDEEDAEWPAEYRIEFPLSFGFYARANAARKLREIRGRPSFTASKFVTAAVVGVATGTLFYDLDYGDYRTKFGLCFSNAMFLGLSGLAGIPALIERRRCFYKMRGAGFFPTSSFVVGNFLVDAPLTALEAVVFTNATYWLSGLSASVFGGFFLIVFLVAVSMTQFFGAVAAVAPSSQIAQPAAGLVIVLTVLFSGFIIARKDIPTLWSWLYWFSPIAWGLRSLLVNEFRYAHTYRRRSSGVHTLPGCEDASISDGECFLRQYDYQSDKIWFALGAVVLAAYTVLFSVLQSIALDRLRHDSYAPPPTPLVVVGPGDDDHAKRDDDDDDEKDDDHERGHHHHQGHHHHHKEEQAAPSRGQGAFFEEENTIPLLENNAGGAPGEGDLALPQDDDDFDDAAAAAAFAYDRGSVRHKAALERMRSEREERTEKLGIQLIAATMPFEAMTLAFSEIHYYVDVPRGHRGERLELLSGVSAYAKPGEMTALMGASGAGKTTLLDVIAGRKTGGTITGDVALNGRPKDQALWLRVSGYVEQVDVHSPGTTVREAVDFSASLRLPPSVTAETRRAFVDAVVSVVELDSVAGSLVGTLATGGLSFEGRKRMSLACELGANPSVCFLDEPTSGLDARAALVVIRAIKNVASTGRTVVCTVHQPSYALFRAFDKLLLLANGGRTVYFGELTDLVPYLENAAVALGNTEVGPLAPGANPATWMLTAAADPDFASFYRKSSLAEANLRAVRAFLVGGGDDDDDDGGAVGAVGAAEGTNQGDLEAPLLARRRPVGGAPVGAVSRYATSSTTQFRILSKKLAVTYWRSPQYNVSRCLVSVVIALIFGSCYTSPVEDVADALGRSGLFFVSTYFMGLIYMNTTTTLTSLERAAYYRETASSMYRPLPYALAFVFVEIPYVVVFSFLFVSLLYALVDLYGGLAKYFWYLGIYAAFVTCFCFFGQFLVITMPDLATAQAFGPPITSIFSLFSGFVIQPSKIPDFWKFAYYMSPVHWMLEGLIVTQFHGVHKKVLTGVDLQPDGTVLPATTSVGN